MSLIFRNLINVIILYTITGLSRNLANEKVMRWSLFMSQVTHPALLYLGFNSMKQQEVLLFLLDWISLSLITPLFFFYPVNSVIQPLNNRYLVGEGQCPLILLDREGEYLF